ncbi:MAG: hypothetical protein ACRC3Y_08285 [Romboutsia sp.]|uniref:hypothetical protein n=1 Tax=Romboutsia sp. TaxID=1965302 RepID=UPI003F2D6739
MLENGKKSCSCKNTNCKVHGNCKECIERHKGGSKLPHCKRPENIEVEKKKSGFSHVIC